MINCLGIAVCNPVVVLPKWFPGFTGVTSDLSLLSFRGLTLESVLLVSLSLLQILWSSVHLPGRYHCWRGLSSVSGIVSDLHSDAEIVQNRKKSSTHALCPSSPDGSYNDYFHQKQAQMTASTSVMVALHPLSTVTLSSSRALTRLFPTYRAADLFRCTVGSGVLRLWSAISPLLRMRPLLPASCSVPDSGQYLSPGPCLSTSKDLLVWL